MAKMDLLQCVLLYTHICLTQLKLNELSNQKRFHSTYHLSPPRKYLNFRSSNLMHIGETCDKENKDKGFSCRSEMNYSGGKQMSDYSTSLSEKLKIELREHYYISHRVVNKIHVYKTFCEGF